MANQERVVDVETVQRAGRSRRADQTSSPSRASLLRFHRWSRSAGRQQSSEAEMDRLGFDAISGLIEWATSSGGWKHGPRVILFDSHIDTVGIGDPGSGNGIHLRARSRTACHARGASDEKGSTPGMVYGLAIARAGPARRVDGLLLRQYGVSDGIAPRALVEDEGIRPDYVVIGEPTKMQVYRGHKGRVEMQVAGERGKSAHAASNELGDNAIHKLLPVIEAVSQLEPELGNDPFLGHGKITVTDIEVETPSINAVPNRCTVFIDRRLTFGNRPMPRSSASAV